MLRDRFRQTLIAVLAIAAAGGANAQANETVRGFCIPSGCDEFSVISKQAVSAGTDGELFRTRVRVVQASSEGTSIATEEEGYVYCSLTRPAVINAAEGGQAVAYLLAPDEATAADMQRVSTNFFALYFTLCHDAAAGRAVVSDRIGATRSLGYQVVAHQAQTVTLNRVEDVLQPR